MHRVYQERLDLQPFCAMWRFLHALLQQKHGMPPCPGLLIHPESRRRPLQLLSRTPPATCFGERKIAGRTSLPHRVNNAILLQRCKGTLQSVRLGPKAFSPVSGVGAERVFDHPRGNSVLRCPTRAVFKVIETMIAFLPGPCRLPREAIWVQKEL